MSHMNGSCLSPLLIKSLPHQPLSCPSNMTSPFALHGLWTCSYLCPFSQTLHRAGSFLSRLQLCPQRNLPNLSFLNSVAVLFHRALYFLKPFLQSTCIHFFNISLCLKVKAREHWTWLAICKIFFPASESFKHIISTQKKNWGMRPSAIG